MGYDTRGILCKDRRQQRGRFAAPAQRSDGAEIHRFIGKYPADTSWGSLESAINSQDWEAAFRAAHTLKGVAQNLGFQRLYLSSTALTEALRGPKPLTDPALREAVAMDQAALLTAIQELEDSHHSTEKT